MRRLLSLPIVGILAACTTLQSPPQTADELRSPDQVYCTQFGPMAIRMDEEKASGIFSIRQNGDMGVMVGPLSGNNWTARWYEIKSSGDIEIEFSKNRERFSARYRLDKDPDKWYEGWVGVLRPDWKAAKIEDGEMTLICL